MRKIILQHGIAEQVAMIDLVKPINQKYAIATGFEYYTDTKVRCADRPHYWEKIAYLRAFLPQVPDDTLMVWEDADSINVKNDSFEAALPISGTFGMVQNRFGLNGSKLLNWYNSGVIAFINTPIIRDFLDRVWTRNGANDEIAMMAEVQSTNGIIAPGVFISSIHPKWNGWLNNVAVCPDPTVKSFHGIILKDKLAAMQKYIDSMPTLKDIRSSK
jgi:hypothetical protein